MEAAVTIAALPVAAFALWALLRAPSASSRLVAQPTGERWHERPTPTFGGVGIACGLTAGAALALAVGAVDASWELAGILAGCGLLFAAGVVDDVRHLSPLAKLVYAEVVNRIGRNGESWPSVRGLARDLGASSGGIRLALGVLEREKLLTVERAKRGAPNRYRLPGACSGGTEP